MANLLVETVPYEFLTFFIYQILFWVRQPNTGKIFPS